MDHTQGPPAGANVVSGTVAGPVVQVSGTLGSLELHLVDSQPRRLGAVRVPRELPAASRRFVNRTLDVEAMDAIHAASCGADAPTVLVLVGQGGVGKSAVARFWANQRRAEFADGQIHLDLDELRQGGAVAPADLLGIVLRSLGVADQDLPLSLHERRQRFLSATAGLRVVIVVDGVQHAGEVDALVPNAPGSAVLACARVAPGGLAYDGAEVVRLRMLEPEHAHALLVAQVGPDRAAREDPQQLDRLVANCEGLPLAVTLCAAMLTRSDLMSAATLADALEDEDGRLDRLGSGPASSLRAVFDQAEARLGSRARVAYRRLGLHPGVTFDLAAAAAAIGWASGPTAVALEELVQACMLETRGGQFNLPGLLRLHARSLGRDSDADEQHAVLARLADHYCLVAVRIDHSLTADRHRVFLSSRPRPAASERLAKADAFACFEESRAAMLAVARQAHDAGLWRPVWVMAEALWPAFHNRKHPEDAHELFALGAAAGLADGNYDAHARLLAQQARALLDLADPAGAAVLLEQAHEVAARSLDPRLRASIIEWRGVAHLAGGESTQAAGCFALARDLFAAQGERRGVMLQDYLLAKTDLAQERYAEAWAGFDRAARAAADLGDEVTLVKILEGRARARLEAELNAAPVDGSHPGAAPRPQEVVDDLQAAADLAQHLGLRALEASVREQLGDGLQAAGDLEVAEQQLRRAEVLYRDIHDPRALLLQARLEPLAGADGQDL